MRERKNLEGTAEVTLDDEGMFWEIGSYAPNCSAYVSQIFSQESQTIADYENMNMVRKEKAAKILKK